MAKDAQPSALARALTGAQYFTVAFGCVVGVAWVIVLGDVVARAGPGGAALGMGLGALAILAVAACYGEAAAARPAAGGELVYAYDLGGAPAAFAIGWLLVLVYVSACAFEAISIGAVADLLFPGMSGPTLWRLLGRDVRAGASAVGLVLALALCALNIGGVALSGRAQQVATYVRIALMVVFLGVAVAFGSAPHLTPLFRHGAAPARIRDVLAVVAVTPFWFGGFTVFATAAEESAQSMRRVGVAIVVAVAAAGAFYVVLILSVSALAPWPQLVRLDLPAAQAFELGLGSPIMAKLVLAVALAGALTAWNALLLAGSRVLFAMGRARLAPPVFARLNSRTKSPAGALVFITLVSLAALPLGRSFVEPLVSVTSVAYGAMYVVTILMVVKLRRRAGPKPAFAAPRGVAPFALAASAAILVDSLVEPWLGAHGRVPVEWLTLAGWSALGILVWLASTKARGALGEAERARRLRGYLNA